MGEGKEKWKLRERRGSSESCDEEGKTGIFDGAIFLGLAGRQPLRREEGDRMQSGGGARDELQVGSRAIRFASVATRV